MYTNVNLAAPLGALAFLGTGVLVFLLAGVLLFALWKKRKRTLRVSALLILMLAGAYLITAAFFSIGSSEKVLAHGQEKHFCELDCHLAYSIADVTKTKTLGTSDAEKTAAGLYFVVSVKTRFNETTISSRRGNAPLFPNGRTFIVVDEEGNHYQPAAGLDAALAASGGSGTPITTPLRPGESYTTRIVFDLPADVRNPSLLINESAWLTHLIIGHENSPLHKQTRFQL